MDGYAVRASEAIAGASLRIAFEIPAGRSAPRGLEAGECARLFTGAPIPSGADAVVMQEQVRREGDRAIFESAAKQADHVRFAGSDARSGEVLLTSGTTLDAGGISLVAALGFAHVEVGRRPSIAILATGDELRVAGEPLGPGLLYESNTFGLAQQARDAGAIPLVLGIAPDRPEIIAERLRSSAADVHVTSGGAAVGDFDFAREVMAQLGGRKVFWQVAIRPGRPVLFGVLDRGARPPSLFFALPGNPAASALTFDQLVRPALRAMQGAARPRRERVRAILDGALSKPEHLTFFARGRLVAKASSLHFVPAKLQGSMSIPSLSGLGAIGIAPAGVARVEAGQELEVEAWDVPGVA